MLPGSVTATHRYNTNILLCSNVLKLSQIIFTFSEDYFKTKRNVPGHTQTTYNLPILALDGALDASQFYARFI
jgi:hypothetical protein